MTINLLRFGLLTSAVVLALAALLTTIVAPAWINWQIRILAGMFVGEKSLWLSLLPLAIAIASWFLRRGSPYVSAATIVTCLLAIVLMLKPVIQAMNLSRALPSQLAAAFGPAEPKQKPFFLSRAFRGDQPEAPVETMNYSGSLKLDFYRAVGRTFAPCVVVLHGGAWCVGDRFESTWFDHRLVQLGYAVAAIDYRLAPLAIWPAQREDVLAAIAFLREFAPKLGIDPRRLVLLGRSAGAQLALVTAYGKRDSGIRGVIAFHAPSDMRMTLASAKPSERALRQLVLQYMGGEPAKVPAAYDQASARQLVSAGDMPTLLIHGQLDSIVSAHQSEQLSEKLTSLGVPHALVLLPWSRHGFDIAKDGPGERLASYAIEWFLSTATR